MKKYIGMFAVLLTVVLNVSCEYITDLEMEAGLTDGLVAYWPVVGTDYSGLEYDYKGDNNISFSGIGTKVDGKFLTAIRIPDGGASISCSSFIFPSTGEITITAWVKILGARGFGININDGSVMIMLAGGPNYINAFFSTPSYQAETGTWDNSWLNTWKYISGTYDGKIIKFYVDGNLAASTACTEDISVYTLNRATLNGYCLLDEIRIYNRALSEAEIKKLMTVGIK